MSDKDTLPGPGHCGEDVAAYALGALAAAHAAAALKHHWIDRDATLRRMMGAR